MKGKVRKKQNFLRRSIPLLILALTLPVTLFVLKNRLDIRQRAQVIQSEYLVNLIYLKPKDQPERPDLQDAAKKGVHEVARNWFGLRVGKTWKLGKFQYVVSTLNSEQFAHDNAYEAYQDLQFNFNIPVFPHDDPPYAPYWTRKRDNYNVIAPFTTQREINIIFVQTNQAVCNDGAHYIDGENWGVVTLEGKHLLNLLRTPNFNPSLPPWNTTNPNSKYYDWQNSTWIDPVVKSQGGCYGSQADVYWGKPDAILDTTTEYNHSVGKIIHEIGHSLGLAHPPQDSPDFYNTFIGSGWINWPNTTMAQYQIDKLGGTGQTPGSPYMVIPCDIVTQSCNVTTLVSPIPTPCLADRGRTPCTVPTISNFIPTPVNCWRGRCDVITPTYTPTLTPACSRGRC